MNILLICNDFYHPGEIIVEGLSFLRAEGHTLDVQSDASFFQPDILKQYEVVIFAKSDEVSASKREKWETPEVQRALQEYVEHGGRLFAIHSGIVGHEETEQLRTLIGCRFSHHPEQCPVTVRPVKKHTITENISDFVEVDEHYFIELLTDDLDILMHSISRYGEVPACYTRTQGKGRICTFTPGHNPSVWQNPVVRQIMRNVLKWMMETDVPSQLRRQT